MFHFNLTLTYFFNQSEGRVDRVTRSVAVDSGSTQKVKLNQ